MRPPRFVLLLTACLLPIACEPAQVASPPPDAGASVDLGFPSTPSQPATPDLAPGFGQADAAAPGAGDAAPVVPDAGLPPDSAVPDAPSLPDAAVADLAAPASTEELLVRQAFCRVLSRPADAPGLTFWVDQINQGQVTVKGVVSAMATSDEFRQTKVTGQGPAAVIAAVYDALLARVPDAAGETFWLAQLAAGGDYSEIALSLVSSPEYAASFGESSVPGGGRPGCN